MRDNAALPDLAGKIIVPPTRRCEAFCGEVGDRGETMRSFYVALMVALPIAAVGAQQPTSITLSCNGTSKLMTAGDDTKPDPVTNLGMIVNFAERTVSFEFVPHPIREGRQHDGVVPWQPGDELCRH